MVNEYSEPIEALEGVNGDLELYADRVVIRKSGLIAKLTQSFEGNERTIYFHQISGIHFFEGQFLINGYIQLLIDHDPQKTITFVFPRQRYALALRIKERLEDAISRYGVYPHLQRRLRRV
jgi:hypothetical protein